jgi:anaerobic ribonucleoside-triphosphate reductase activating protein
MYIARILYPVEVLGPGKRIGIWFCGCSHGCKGCSNPELWQKQEKYKINIDSVLKLIHQISDTNPVDGFTITGGDPMEQSEELQHLLKMLKSISEDILVYTGFEIEELTENQLENISVLIDGKYVEELNDNSLLRGSSNQRIHILDKKHQSIYETYLNSETNKIQNFTTSDGVVSVGIHKPDFMKEEK